MATSIRERHARLLADSRSSEPRTRLSQAVTRADFLLRLSRTVSAIQNPQRALEALTTLLLDDMVDIAEVVVRTGPWELVCGATRGQVPACSSLRWADVSPAAFEEIIRRGAGQELTLPSSGPARDEALASLFPPDTARAVEELRAEELVILPLAARGRCFGLLVLGRAPGFTFSGSDTFLADLAQRVAVGLDASLLVAESRYVATVLRQSLAPDETPQVPGLDIATFYNVAHASEALGGDFLDIHGPDDDLTLICGDVAGKGVEAAVHAKRLRNAVRTAAMVERSPGWVLGLVNRVAVAEASDFSEGLATAVCARLRRGEGMLHIDLANAGHPPALVVRADGTVETVESAGVALALLPDSEFAERSIRLGPLDTLVLYTDGVTGARGIHDLFGDERLRQHLALVAGLPASAVVDSLAVAVSEHLGDRTRDDIAVVAVRYQPDDE